MILKAFNHSEQGLGLLLLLSVCSLLSDSKVTCQENSDNSYFKQAKCISVSNSFPEGNGSILNVDLNRWCEGRNCHIATRCYLSTCNYHIIFPLFKRYLKILQYVKNNSTQNKNKSTLTVTPVQ